MGKVYSRYESLKGRSVEVRDGDGQRLIGVLKSYAPGCTGSELHGATIRTDDGGLRRLDQPELVREVDPGEPAANSRAAYKSGYAEELCSVCGHPESWHIVYQGNLTNFYGVCKDRRCGCTETLNANGPHPREIGPPWSPADQERIEMEYRILHPGEHST